MTLHEILFGGGGAFLLLLTLVQIAPIKLNPWSALARMLGRAINGEVLEKVDALSVEVKAVQADAAERKAINCRARILRFGDEVLHGQRHSKEHFDQILLDISTYERYCSEHPDFENNVTDLTSERIKKVYMHCIEKNDFL